MLEGILLILVALTVGLPIVIHLLMTPKFAFAASVVVAFFVLVGSWMITAWYCPWMYAEGTASPKRFVLFGTIIIFIVLMLFNTIKKIVGSKYGPTEKSLADLEKEVELMERLADRRIGVMAMVPQDAEDPDTGKPATLAQLMDWRWCARWVAKNGSTRP